MKGGDEVNKMMDTIKQKVADDQDALPALHKEALALKLHPQPWWNRDFYDYAIDQAKAQR